MHRQRSEGFAESTVGRHGIYGIANVESVPGPKVFIFGDSHVEAWQVGNPKKMHILLNSYLQEKGIPVTAIAVGRAADTFPHYYFALPEYVRIAGPAIAHYIILSDMIDTFPDNDGYDARYVMQPEPKWLIENAPRKHQGIKKLFRALYLDFLWRLLREDFMEWQPRFRPGPVEKKNG